MKIQRFNCTGNSSNMHGKKTLLFTTHRVFGLSKRLQQTLTRNTINADVGHSDWIKNAKVNQIQYKVCSCFRKNRTFCEEEIQVQQ